MYMHTFFFILASGEAENEKWSVKNIAEGRLISMKRSREVCKEMQTTAFDAQDEECLLPRIKEIRALAERVGLVGSDADTCCGERRNKRGRPDPSQPHGKP